MHTDNCGVTLGSIPYPFKAMLAICSDLDETPGLECYLSTSRFLNSRHDTEYGPGVGLETGNTIYFHMPARDFSYLSTTDEGREKIRALIRSGHIDCLHSFGDAATSRSQIGKCLTELDAHNCKIAVWIDHAVAPSNFGADIMRGFGDLAGHDAYHADITTEYGIRYISRGRVTSMAGQDAPSSLRGIVSGDSFPSSATTLAKESVKYVLAALGSTKYSMHRGNRLLRFIKLRDGRSVYEFMRSNPHPRGVSCGDNAKGLGEILTDSYFDRLVRRNAKSILYSHLGKKIDTQAGFPAKTVAALRSLRARQDANEILVTTTRRILEYSELCASLKWSADDTGERIRIVIETPDHDLSLQGLSFSVHDKQRRAEVYLGSRMIETECADHPYGAVYYVPWQRLSYPFE